MTSMMRIPNSGSVSFFVLAKSFEMMDTLLRGLERLTKVTLFGSGKSELRLPAEVAKMHALKGSWQSYVPWK